MSFKGKKVFGLIPARGGSKGILDKNIYPVGNKLLIDFTIDAAKDSHNIDHIFVSTDSKKILDHARSKEVKTIIRPDVLANDNSTAVDVVKHFYHSLYELGLLTEGEDFYLCYLQPTSPLRNNKVINQSFNFLEQTKASSLVSLVENKHTPYKSFTINQEGLAKSLFKESYTNQNRQSLDRTYRANGAIYTFLISTFISNDGFPSNKSVAFVMDDIDSLDIDGYDDIDALELLLSTQI